MSFAGPASLPEQNQSAAGHDGGESVGADALLDG